MIRDYLKLALGSLVHRKLRSWLTMIGIFIGITAVIAVISLGQGLETSITEQFSELGSDKLWVQPGGGAFVSTSSAAKLTDADRKAIDRTQGVVDSVGMAFKNSRVGFKDEETFQLVIGYTLDDKTGLWEEIYGAGLEHGRWMDSGDTFKIVVGWAYAQENEIFDRPVQLFDSLEINGEDFEIIGIYEKIGGPDDRNIYMIEDGYERVFNEELQDDYKYIVVKTGEGLNPSVVADRVRKELRDERDRDEGDEDFTIQTTEELLESFGNILLIVQVVILGIAAISLLVGGIGIMNTMYTAVLERTKEIGIMKAIGARNSDILLIFLIESGLLGLVGGGIGVLFGFGLAKLTEWIGTAVLGTTFLTAWWSWELIVLALAFTFIVGVVSGLLPAYQASKQQAVESLRYE